MEFLKNLVGALVAICAVVALYVFFAATIAILVIIFEAVYDGIDYILKSILP